ncbi:MAG: hypothetical protein MUO91_01990 [candidate division Zixibacteria bacterium]|nr:hypothetical protein [candidate division Zixibacteria bacterium]
MAVVALVQAFGVCVISGDSELRKINTLMKEGKFQIQSQAHKIIQDRNARIMRIYAALMFVGAIILSVGGLCK